MNLETVIVKVSATICMIVFAVVMMGALAGCTYTATHGVKTRSTTVATVKQPTITQAQLPSRQTSSSVTRKPLTKVSTRVPRKAPVTGVKRKK